MIDPAHGSASLRRVAAGSLCAGCGACASIAPDSVRIEPRGGFLRPTETGPVTEAENARIAAICPGLGQTVEVRDRHDDVLWGPHLSAYEGWATDTEIRHAGSSGGALSMILVHLLEQGVVDAVLQTAASGDNPLANVTVTSRSRKDVLAAAGSRYAPSAPLAGLGPALASGLRHAFVGKPCDVAALRAMSECDAGYARAFPVLLSFFCAGVPSMTGAGRLLAAMGADPSQVVRFRYRGMGWPGRATAVLADGSERSMSYHDSWGGILSKHVQHRCKICADGTGTAADIVCADAWETDEAGYPLFEEQDGVSLVLTRTALGERLLGEACKSGRLAVRPFELARLAAIQPGQRERRRALLARLLALRLLNRPTPRYRGLRLAEAAAQNGFARNLKNFAGMARRAIKMARS